MGHLIPAPRLRMEERFQFEPPNLLDQYRVRWTTWLALVILAALLCLGLAYGQSIPRKHLSASTETCSGAKCLVVYEGEEHQNEPCYVSLWCNAATPCAITRTFLAGWHDPMISKQLIPPGGFVSWEGIYPRVLRVYVGGGRLPWRIEAEGLRAWEARETIGENQVWPVKHLLRPVKVEVTK